MSGRATDPWATFRGAGMAQWWKLSPPPMYPRFGSDPVPYVGLVCCLFSPFPGSFSLGIPVFFDTQKPTFLNSNSTRIEDLPAKTDLASSLNSVYYFLARHAIFLPQRLCDESKVRLCDRLILSSLWVFFSQYCKGPCFEIWREVGDISNQHKHLTFATKAWTYLSRNSKTVK